MSQTINLGFEVPDYGKSELMSKAEGDSQKTPTKTAYPSLTIPGNIGLARSLKPGAVVTALVTFRVCEVTIRERDGEASNPVDYYGGGTRVELEAQKMIFEGVKIEEGEEEEDGKSAFEKFRQKKVMARNSGDGDEE